jgi:DNA-binding GntR family transcriptional regulator
LAAPTIVNAMAASRTNAGRILNDLSGRPFSPDDTVSRRRDLMLMSIRHTGELTPLAQTIFDELAIQIVEGGLLPGDFIDALGLARRFGTSRTPVREALLALERQRVVVVPPRRRPFIAHVTSQHVRDVYWLRASLFTLVSELILDNYDKVPLDELWSWQLALEDDATRGDITSYFWHNVGFRLLEVQLCASEDVERIISDLGMRTLQFRHLSLSDPAKLERGAADHRRLLIAYEENDRESASALSRGLILSGYRSMLQTGFVDQTPGSVSAPQIAKTRMKPMRKRKR